MDGVAVFDGLDAMGDCDCGPVRHRGVQGTLHFALVIGVKRRSGLVEQQHFWTAQQHPRDRHPLLLAPRNVETADAHLSPQSVLSFLLHSRAFLHLLYLPFLLFFALFLPFLVHFLCLRFRLLDEGHRVSLLCGVSNLLLGGGSVVADVVSV